MFPAYSVKARNSRV